LSFGTKVFSGVQEVFILALMVVTVFGLFYVNISLIYKVGMAAIVFSVIFLMTLATQILRQQKETKPTA
jgi:hypothetical protein